jgi:putative phosphoribosyl transferase
MAMAIDFRKFVDRHDAGRRLALALQHHARSNPIVLALPRGGVPVGFEVAQYLNAQLDLLLVSKIRAPGHPDVGIGAVVDGAEPQLVLNAEAINLIAPHPEYLQEERDRQLQEIERRRHHYCGNRVPPRLEGRAVIIVDDGIATGGTITAALRAITRLNPARTIVATPVAPRGALLALQHEADEVVCLESAEEFHAVSLYYDDFAQTSDEEVRGLMSRSGV